MSEELQTKLEFEVNLDSVAHMTRDQIISHINYTISSQVHELANAIERSRYPKREEVKAPAKSVKKLGSLGH